MRGSVFPGDGAPAEANGILIASPRRTAAEEMTSRLAAIVTSSDDAIIGKTLDGIVTDWNSGAEAIFGYTAAEVIGESLSMLLPPEPGGRDGPHPGADQSRRTGRAL